VAKAKKEEISQALEKKVTSMESEMRELKNKLRGESSRLMAQLQEYSRLETDLSNLRFEKGKIESDKAAQERVTDDLKKKLSCLESTFLDFKQSNNALRKEVCQLEDNIQALMVFSIARRNRDNCPLGRERGIQDRQREMEESA